jgi:hypothetical protein
MGNTKQRLIDCYLSKFKIYRRLVGGWWYKHQFTKDAAQLSPNFVGTFWARYGEINRYSTVIEIEARRSK